MTNFIVCHAEGRQYNVSMQYSVSIADKTRFYNPQFKFKIKDFVQQLLISKSMHAGSLIQIN